MARALVETGIEFDPTPYASAEHPRYLFRVDDHTTTTQRTTTGFDCAGIERFSRDANAAWTMALHMDMAYSAPHRHWPESSFRVGDEAVQNLTQHLNGIALPYGSYWISMAKNASWIKKFAVNYKNAASCYVTVFDSATLHRHDVYWDTHENIALRFPSRFANVGSNYTDLQCVALRHIPSECVVFTVTLDLFLKAYDSAGPEMQELGDPMAYTSEALVEHIGRLLYIQGVQGS